jgi:hypothetical protein
MRRSLAIAGKWMFALLAFAAPSLADVVKPPDQGPFWQPLNPASGTYVYADRFVAPANETIFNAGTWLLLLGGGDLGGNTLPEGREPGGAGTPSSVRFEVWGSVGGAPDPATVLATTGSVTPPVDDTLTLYEYPLQAPVDLIAGTTYFFAATVVGESGDTAWQTGGHTQNSVYNDNGTFWYSNDAAGILFDGQDLLPEFAFSLTGGTPPSVQAIPAAGPIGLALLVGALGIAAMRRLRRS